MKFLGRLTSIVTSTTDMVMGGANRSAFELYGGLPPGNAVFAPFNLSTVLSLAFLGARGETLAEMSRPLYLTEPWARHLAREGVKLSFHSSLWHHPQVSLEPAYLGLLETFKTSPRPLQADQESENPLNAWVAAATDKHIPDLFPEHALRDTRLLLLSTLNLHYPWAQPFERKAQASGLMQYEGTLGFGSHEGFQLLRVGCKDSQVSVLFLLPRERGSLNKQTEGLNYKTFSGWLKELKESAVSVSLPRFEVGSRLELTDSLRGLGLTRAFSSGSADFSGISPEPGLALSRVLQQTRVKVEESGVELTSASAVVFGERPYVTERKPEIRPDHPFMFCLRDKLSGALLGMGRGEQPAS